MYVSAENLQEQKTIFTPPSSKHPRAFVPTAPMLRHTDENYCRKWRTNFDDHGEVFSAHVVVGLDENFTQTTLSDRIVLGVELVEPVKSVAILQTFYFRN